jgi:glycosyltransferase involved in cell wall biosynthesis
MKIAWLTPLATASAIGKVTVQVAEHMQGEAEVHLWCADRGERHQTNVPVFTFDVTDAFEQALRTYDVVLYSFGNYYPYHREIFLMSRRVPGIAILHDYVMHHFFVGRYLDEAGGVERYFDAMQRLYGPDARAAAEASFVREGDRWVVQAAQPPLWGTDRVAEYPLVEDVLDTATGVVVHSDFLAGHVKDVTDAPMRTIRLPAIQRPAIDVPPRESLGIPVGRLLVITIGHVNPNKLVHEVIDALGARPDLAARLFYAVIGPVPGAYADQLQAAVARHGLDASVRFMGPCSEVELQAWLHHADVCLNLRRPVTEGGSASLSDEFKSGKAVIVSDVGVYAEVPDGCALKIEGGREAELIGPALQALVDDPSLRAEIGRSARAYADQYLQPRQYAADLLSFIDESGGYAAMARYADRIGVVLRQIGATPDMAIVGTIARESAHVFEEPVTSPWKPGGARRPGRG